MTKHFENKARREWWGIHIEAWQRSGLSRRLYCRQHRLNEKTFGRWLAVLEDVQALRTKAALAREAKRNKAAPLSRDMRSRAVQAFWAMHVEALTWSRLPAAAYAKTHRLNEYSLRRWRILLETGAVEIDWRTRLHPSALPPISSAARRAARTPGSPISTGASSAAKDGGPQNGLTDGQIEGPTGDGRSNRRRFSDAEKLAIVRESDLSGAKAIEVCRRHGIVTSMLFRWRVQFGYGDKERVRLASVKLPGGRGAAATLRDLLPVPEGMEAVDLPDGRRVFAPAGADPEAVARHVRDQEAAR